MRKTLFAFAALIAASSPASAQLNGQTMLLRYAYNVGFGLQYTDNYGTRVVGPGAEWSPFQQLGTLDVSNSHVSLSWSGNVGYGNLLFNGLVLSDVNNTIGDFAVTGFTYMNINTGFGSPAVTYDQNNVYINFHGMSTTNASRIDFDLNAGDTNVAPEPASMALLATGLVGVGAVVRRRRVS